MTMKTGKDVAKQLKLVFEVQEKTSSTPNLPVFNLWAKNYQYSSLEHVKRHIQRQYAGSYILERKQQTGNADVYYFKALPQEQVYARDTGRSKAAYVQLRVRPKLVGVR